MDIRAKAKEFLDQLPPGVEVRSKGPYAALFTKLTGWTHQRLQQQWALEDIPKAERRKKGQSTEGLPTTTTCNAFTGKFGQYIRSPINLGRFDIEQQLKSKGLGAAWVSANSGNRPGYGDVFKAKRNHVGISLNFVGNTWHTAESGQGGPGNDYKNATDMCKRNQKSWNPSALQGWVDIAVLMKISMKAPKWLKGWWRFEVGGKKHFVYLPERGPALLFPTAPKNPRVPPPPGGKTGDQTYDFDMEGLSIEWSNKTLDKLRHLPNVDYMLGNRGAMQIQAFKLK